MLRHRAIVVGAGRIGAGYNWNQDLGYTHAGAYMALKDRVELVGFVEPSVERGEAVWKKWGVPFYRELAAFDDFGYDIVSVCVQPEQQAGVLAQLAGVKGVWCEKPWVSPNVHFQVPVQVNYQRRADPHHQELRYALSALRGHKRLIVYGRPDETTRCHFRDLSRFWNVPLDYRPFNGPCAYVLETEVGPYWFDGGNGGVDSAKAFVGMLENLLDAVDNGTPLLSPPYMESA